MAKKILTSISLAAALVASPAMAGQSASYLGCADQYVDHGVDPSMCRSPVLQLQVDTSSDAGKPGAVWVGVDIDDGSSRFLLAQDGTWVSAVNRYEPYLTYNTLPPRVSFQLSNGQASYGQGWSGGAGMNVCAQSGAWRKVDLWIAYGAVQPDKMALINGLHAVQNPRISPQSLMWTYAQTDGLQAKKYGVVWTVNCQSN